MVNGGEAVYKSDWTVNWSARHFYFPVLVYSKGVQVVFVVLTKLHAKYKIRVDRELTFEIARAHNLSPNECGGDPDIGGISSGGQLIIPLENGAKALFGTSTVQVYWSTEEDITEIEFLNGLVAFMADERKRFDCSTLEDVRAR
jgi:hypothetical protein